jgi:hypothetical protein
MDCAPVHTYIENEVMYPEAGGRALWRIGDEVGMPARPGFQSVGAHPVCSGEHG